MFQTTNQWDMWDIYWKYWYIDIIERISLRISCGYNYWDVCSRFGIYEDMKHKIWHIIWNNAIYGCRIYDCILFYTIRIWYGTVYIYYIYYIYINIEDILWIYKPTVFYIGEIDTAIYIWYVKVGIRIRRRGDFLPGKKAKHIMGDMIINVFLKLGYTVGKLMIKKWIQGKAIFKYTDMVFSWNKIID